MSHVPKMIDTVSGLFDNFLSNPTQFEYSKSAKPGIWGLIVWLESQHCIQAYGSWTCSGSYRCTVRHTTSQQWCHNSSRWVLCGFVWYYHTLNAFCEWNFDSSKVWDSYLSYFMGGGSLRRTIKLEAFGGARHYLQTMCAPPTALSVLSVLPPMITYEVLYNTNGEWYWFIMVQDIAFGERSTFYSTRLRLIEWNINLSIYVKSRNIARSTIHHLYIILQFPLGHSFHNGRVLMGVPWGVGVPHHEHLGGRSLPPPPPDWTLSYTTSHKQPGVTYLRGQEWEDLDGGALGGVGVPHHQHLGGRSPPPPHTGPYLTLHSTVSLVWPTCEGENGRVVMGVPWGVLVSPIMSTLEGVASPPPPHTGPYPTLHPTNSLVWPSCEGENGRVVMGVPWGCWCPPSWAPWRA